MRLCWWRLYLRLSVLDIDTPKMRFEEPIESIDFVYSCESGELFSIDPPDDDDGEEKSIELAQKVADYRKEAIVVTQAGMLVFLVNPSK